MKWHKLGLIYTPRGDRWWARNFYAFNPTAEVAGDTLRVYFASLDEHNYGRVGYVELDRDNPQKVLFVSPEPVLDVGALGAFDDCGVTPACIANVGGRECLYYIGWQRCERVPYMLFSGVAIRENQSETFERYSRVPVFDRTVNEPFSRSAPCVLAEPGGFRAWYWSCERWTVEGGWVHYNNVIRHAVSTDGFNWTSTGHICITPRGPDEYSIGRPWIVREEDLYRMWYSVRSRAGISYRIGYAESTDGFVWERKDEDVGIAPSLEGWDSEMICHACVVDVGGRRYMFYNGNRHGRYGFGCAVLESD